MTTPTLSGKRAILVALAAGAMAAGSAAAGEMRTFTDFEDASILRQIEVKGDRPGELSGEHVTSGRQSLKIAAGSVLVWGSWARLPGDWSGYDAFEMDVYNDTGGPVTVGLNINDKPGGGDYWNRHIANFSIPPGKHVFKFPTSGLYRGEPGSRYNLLKTDIDVKQITRIILHFGKGEGSLYLDNMRLTKSAIPDWVRAFDFGPPGQPLEPGFKPVTYNQVYAKASGYGIRRAQPTANFARDDTWPTNLYRDYVVLVGGEFMVDLPDGRYHCFAVYNNCGYWGGETCRHTKRHIEAEGKVAWSEDLGEMGGYAFPNTVFEDVEPLPGADFWDLYMERMFEPKRFIADVSDGQLNVKFVADAGWSSNLAVLVAYPDSEKAEGDRFIEGILAAQEKEFKANSPEMPIPTGGDINALPPAERNKGYVFFLTHYQKDTYLTAVPAREQIAREKSISACLGEYEPVTFAVRPLKDLGRARVTASEFTGPAGTIPASAWDLQVVRHLSRRPANATHYRIIPQVLKPFDEVELPEGLTREFWATVRVPEDAAGGEYSGTIRITSDGGLEETLKVKLTVLPFKLDGSDYVFGFFGRVPDEKVGRLLVEYGMNSVTGGPRVALSGWGADGRPMLDFSAVDEYMELLRRWGFSRELCGYGGPSVAHVGYTRDEGFFGEWEKKTGESYVELLKSVFDEVKKHAEDAEWLPFTYNLGDETRNPDYAKKQVAQIKAIQEAAPWLKTTAQYSVSYRNGAGPGNYHQWIFEALKTSGLNNHDESVMEKAKELGKEVYIYNQGQSRYSFGAYQWSEYTKGVRGRYQWHLHIQHGFQFFDLDGREPDTGVVYYGREGPIPTLALERCREGADDFYYCQTLANLIEKGKAAGGKAARAAAEAEAMLKAVTDRIGINERRQPDWLDNDKLRADCAAGILAIREAVRPAHAAKPLVAAPTGAKAEPPEAAPAPQEGIVLADDALPGWAIGLVAVVVVAVVVALILVLRPKGRGTR